MKKTFFILSALFIATLFSSCDKDEPETPTVGETKEVYIDATSGGTWQYFSFKENKIIGVGAENDEQNAIWFARNDWDIAIKRYAIRTNSGKATSINSKGGVYITDENVTFESITAMPENITFLTDKAVTEQGMGGTTTTTIKSDATVIKFKLNDDGTMVMPPVYLKAPVYIFRSADGKANFKVYFTQYKDENNVSGHVKFNFAEIK